VRKNIKTTFEQSIEDLVLLAIVSFDPHTENVKICSANFEPLGAATHNAI